MKTLYLDMDGVLADFNTAARRKLKASKEEAAMAAQQGRWPEAQWRQLIEDEHFYRNLPKMPKADQMVELAKKFRDNLGWRLLVLTAIPSKNDVPEAFYDKIEWMTEYYPGIRVHFGPYSKDKYQHCNPGDILVDDRNDNVKSWAEAGGIPVHVTDDYDSALEKLELLYRKNLMAVR